MPTSFIVIEMLIIIVRSKVLFMFKIYVTKAMSFFLLNKTSCIFKDHDPAPFLSLSAPPPALLVTPSPPTDRGRGDAPNPLFELWEPLPPS
jgi:hypothetical protein